jgi:uncharacterized protein YndB with AHSA1/START domain/DNA-binding transcriptional ArsR family regulator
MKQATGDDIVFRALADSSRRAILDFVKARPGITVGELADEFEFTRYALMKHVRSLEAANLLVFLREGKKKRLYLNGIPLQRVYDRWMSQYSGYWARHLTELQDQLEREGGAMPDDLKHVHVLFIRTTVDALWDALTTGAMTNQYYFHSSVVSDFRPGEDIRYVMKAPDGSDVVPVWGKILECVPKRKLAHTFSIDGAPGQESRVTYDLEPAGDAVKLTVVHDRFGDNVKAFESTTHGWPVILSGLKTLLETGQPLTFGGMSVE